MTTLLGTVALVTAGALAATFFLGNGRTRTGMDVQFGLMVFLAVVGFAVLCFTGVLH